MEDTKEYFNKTYNISYVDPSLPTPDNKQILKHYSASVFLYGLGILAIFFNNWLNQLTVASFGFFSVKGFFLAFYVLYIIFAPLFLFKYRPKSVWISNNLAICGYLKRLFFQKRNYRLLSPDEIKTELANLKPTYKEQQALILYFIKIFFGPQMVQYAANNVVVITGKFPEIKSLFIAATIYDRFELMPMLREQMYLFILPCLFFIDTFIFAIGYLTELVCFNNKIRSVESTAFGLIICLICYPPFNKASTVLFQWYQSESATVLSDPNSVLTWVFRYCGIAFITIYVTASIALALRASNLTNRGTVSTWPYSVIRHPAYTTKVTFWWLTTIPFLFVNFSSPNFHLGQYLIKASLIIISLITWTTIYILRGLTEERHLIKDPEYQNYVKKVKYRFIPWII